MDEEKKSVTPIIVSVVTLILLIGLLTIVWIVALSLLEGGRLEFVVLGNTSLGESLLFYLFLAGIVAVVFFSLSLFLLLTAYTRAGVLASYMTKDLLASREMFLQLYNSSPVPYLLISKKNKISLPNKAAFRLFGLSAQEFEDKNLLDFFLPDDLDHVQMLLERVKNNASVHEEELQIVRADGEVRWVIFSMFPFKSATRKKYQSGLATFVDITERKEVDKAKTEFVSLAAHQLRTPLSAIKWYTELLSSRDIGGLNSQQEEYLEKVYAGNERMIDLVNTLLNVSRLELGTLAVDIKPTDVVELMESVFEELEAQIQEKHFELKKEYDENIILMDTDPKLLRMVFQNLLSNAVKYTPEGGKLGVKITSRGSELHITVADSGLGIPKNQQDKIFTKLFRADNARKLETKGTGLGLYIVKMIVEEFGGSVSFSSEPNAGTTFKVVLPL